MQSIIPSQKSDTLPAMLHRAANTLDAATTSAEVLEARDMAAVAYDAAKSAGRIARAKQAHDEVLSAVYRAQADALKIEARAKMRLADEYDAAQERGEVRKAGNSSQPEELISAPDIGLTHKQIHEARQMRDAETDDPGIVDSAVEEIVARKEEPTKAALQREIKAKRGKKKPKRQLDEKPTDVEELTASDELLEAQHTIADLAEENERLRDRIAVESMDGSEEAKTEAAQTIAELRAENKTLRAELNAVKVSRDQFQNENASMRRQMAAQRREIDRLKSRVEAA